MESEDGMCWGGEVVGEGGGEVKGGGMNRKTYPIIRLSYTAYRKMEKNGKLFLSDVLSSN